MTAAIERNHVLSTPEQLATSDRLRPVTISGLSMTSLVMLVEAVGTAVVATFLVTDSVVVTATVAATVVACLAVVGRRG
jgi:hypothetical protein